MKMGLIEIVKKVSKKVKTISANIKEASERSEERKRAKLDKELEDLPKQIELEEKRLRLDALKRKRAELNGQNGNTASHGFGSLINEDAIKINLPKDKMINEEQLEKDTRITYAPSPQPMVKHPELRRDNKPFKQPELKGKNKPFKQLNRVK